MPHPIVLRPDSPVVVTVRGDVGAFVVSTVVDEIDGPPLPELDGTGLRRRFQASEQTMWIGVAPHAGGLFVRLAARTEPPPLTGADRIVECVLDCPDGVLAVHDGPEDCSRRGTIALDPGRWTLRVSQAQDHADTAAEVVVELWPTTDPPGSTMIVRPEEPVYAPDDEGDVRLDAAAWDARAVMRSVTGPAAGRVGAVSLHLDDDGDLWAFDYVDGSRPRLRRLAHAVTTEVLADATVGDRWT